MGDQEKNESANRKPEHAEGAFFKYGQQEIDYLSRKDKKLAWAIEKIGMIERPVVDDLFSSVIDSILGQQISTAAHKTIRKRIAERIPDIDSHSIMEFGRDNLQSLGITYRKADYILEFAQKVENGEFDVNELYALSDEEVIDRLCKLNGIGRWTAEMLMTFCMQRPDIVSYGDLAILRGMRMLYRHRRIDKQKFDRYKKRYSPYGTVASLYLWAIAGGAIPELTDPAPKSGTSKRKR